MASTLADRILTLHPPRHPSLNKKSYKLFDTGVFTIDDFLAGKLSGGEPEPLLREVVSKEGFYLRLKESEMPEDVLDAFLSQDLSTRSLLLDEGSNLGTLMCHQLAVLGAGYRIFMDPARYDDPNPDSRLFWHLKQAIADSDSFLFKIYNNIEKRMSNVEAVRAAVRATPEDKNNPESVGSFAPSLFFNYAGGRAAAAVGRDEQLGYGTALAKAAGITSTTIRTRPVVYQTSKSKDLVQVQFTEWDNTGPFMARFECPDPIAEETLEDGADRGECVLVHSRWVGLKEGFRSTNALLAEYWRGCQNAATITFKEYVDNLSPEHQETILTVNSLMDTPSYTPIPPPGPGQLAIIVKEAIKTVDQHRTTSARLFMRNVRNNQGSGNTKWNVFERHLDDWFLANDVDISQADGSSLKQHDIKAQYINDVGNNLHYSLAIMSATSEAAMFAKKCLFPSERERNAKAALAGVFAVRDLMDTSSADELSTAAVVATRAYRDGSEIDDADLAEAREWIGRLSFETGEAESVAWELHEAGVCAVKLQKKPEGKVSGGGGATLRFQCKDPKPTAKDQTKDRWGEVFGATSIAATSNVSEGLTPGLVHLIAISVFLNHPETSYDSRKALAVGDPGMWRVTGNALKKYSKEYIEDTKAIKWLLRQTSGLANAGKDESGGDKSGESGDEGGGKKSGGEGGGKKSGGENGGEGSSLQKPMEQPRPDVIVISESEDDEGGKRGRQSQSQSSGGRAPKRASDGVDKKTVVIDLT